MGGGLLGLELADEIHNSILDVTVVEVADRILPRQVDEKGSELFEKSILKAGLKLVKGASVSEIIGDHSPKAVVLNNGEKIEADLVLVSAGVRSNIDLAKEAGIECNRGILVDEHMKTNKDGVYAAGDVAEFESVNYAIWTEAVEQGKVAGANAIGDEILYSNFVPYTIFNGLGTRILSVGHIMSDSEDIICEATIDEEKGVYKKLVFKDNQLIGGILIGDIGKSRALIGGLEKKKAKEEMMDLLK